MKRILPGIITFCLLVFGAVNESCGLDLDKIKVCVLKGDYKSAIVEGEEIMAGARYSPELDDLYYLLGLSYLKQGNYLRASDIFEIILKEFRNSRLNEEAKIGLGDCFLLAGEYTKAENRYKEFLRRNYRSRFRPQVYYRIGLCAAKSGNAKEAEEYLKKLNQQYPFYIEITREKEPEAAGELYYTVQVGAFSSAANAEKLMQELSRKGHPAYIEETGPQGIVSYRVRAGKFAARRQAEGLRERIIRDGFPANIIPSQK